MAYIHWRKGILFRSVAILFASFLATGLVAVLVTTYVVGARANREANERLDQLLATIESTASVACFAKDDNIAKDIVQGLLNNKEISAVYIEARDIDSRYQPLAGKRMEDGGSFFSVREVRSPFDNAMVVGRVTLYGNSRVIEDGIHDEITYVTVQIAGQLLLIALIVAAVMLFYIIRPIKAMSDGLHVMDPTEGERLPCPANHANTELGRLVDDINSLAADLVDVVRQERTLRDEYQTIFDNAETGIFIVSPDGSLTSWNPSFARMMGIPRFEACNKPPALIELPWAAPERVRELLETCHTRRAGMADDLELTANLPDARWVNVILTLIGDNLLQGVVHDITLHKSAENHARLQAITDPLTQVRNRLGFEAMLNDRLRSDDAGGFALMMLDLDGFRRVNEGYGLPAGDALLKNLTGRLRADIKASDCLARLSADRFVLALFSVEGKREPEAIAERLLNAVRPTFHVAGVSIQVHASIGVTQYPTDGLSTADLLRNAELALDEAKKEGGNRYRHYDNRMAEAAKSRLQLEADLRHAAQEGGFRLFFQPIVDLGAKRMVGVEALIRWPHPGLGMVTPDRFIPLAEEVGMIDGIGLWVLDSACALLAEWQQLDIDWHISLNVSGRQIPDGLTPSHIADAIARHDLDPSKLVIEITEGILMADIGRSQAWLDAVHKVGCGIYLDDFGTGYSSLSYLKRFPVDTLKIDKSFIRDMRHDSNDRTLVEAIIAMAGSLSMDVVAEGVENADQLAMLRQIGCHYAQGYLFSRPRPADDLKDIDARIRQMMGDEQPSQPALA